MDTKVIYHFDKEDHLTPYKLCEKCKKVFTDRILGVCIVCIRKRDKCPSKELMEGIIMVERT